jgi:molecular chaperone GrpE (heat shock protein)
MLSIQNELRALRPSGIADALVDHTLAPSEPDPSPAWEVLAKTLGRFGKQQLRTNQQTELLVEELRSALEHTKSANEALRDQADDYRREAQRLASDGREVRETALTVLDALDDLAVIARQKNDPQWTSRVERLTSRTLNALAEMGLTEVPAISTTFDERTHEIVDTVDRSASEPYQIVEVLRRGFWFNGTILRRAQVVTTH